MAELLAAPSIDNTQEYDIVLNPTDALNNPGPIDGAPIVEVLSGEVTIVQDPATPLVITVRSTSTYIGNYKISAKADPNMDPNVTEALVLEVEGTVTQAEVVNSGASFSAARTRPA